MKNKIQQTFYIRNIIMSGSLLIAIISILRFYNNVRLVGLILVPALILFIGSYKAMHVYMQKQFTEKMDLDNIIDFFSKKKRLYLQEKADLFNALLWCGEDERIADYIKNNALPLEQKLSYEFYKLDKKLIKENDVENDMYPEAFLRIQGLLEAYQNCKKKDNDVVNKFHAYFDFYQSYYNKQYDSALAEIDENVSKGNINDTWRIYHKGIVYKQIGDIDKADLCFAHFKICGGHTRFHKWLGIESDTKGQSSIAMWSFMVAIVLYLVVVIVLWNHQYSSVQEALKWEYGDNESNLYLITESYDDGQGVSIYSYNDSVLYCNYCKNDHGYTIKKRHVDKNIKEDRNDSFFNSSTIVLINGSFYKETNYKPEIIITKGDSLDQNVIRNIQVESIESKTVNNELYYLVAVK